ncbi:sortilin-related receptor-like [Pomacea canaliculata]|uniref:sortilin-related receptor-like n=1 Tax=Pomacea canaliculata TaxID=400727 RepID=UPI000D735F41|nr:sortilin-related receptor-like [Pomacea canaliculata]
MQGVPYPLVCDHRPDCSDNSDESFCVFSSCPWYKNVFQCSNKQCIPDQFRCDGFWHCLDGSDEVNCPCHRVSRVKEGLPPPAVIDIDSDGALRGVKPLITTNQPLCPKTHFQCPGIDILLSSVYVRCNGVFDCPGKQDETACDTYTCPGYYRCRSSPRLPAP